MFQNKLQRHILARLVLLLLAGKATNLVVVPRSSLLSTPNQRKVSNQYTVAPLEKYSQPINSEKETTTLLCLCRHHKVNQTSFDLQSSCLLMPYMSSSQKTQVLSMRLKVETEIQNRLWARSMAKHVMEINKQLQSHLSAMILRRINSKKTRKTGGENLQIQSSV